MYDLCQELLQGEAPPLGGEQLVQQHLQLLQQRLRLVQRPVHRLVTLTGETQRGQIPDLSFNVITLPKCQSCQSRIECSSSNGHLSDVTVCAGTGKCTCFK